MFTDNRREKEVPMWNIGFLMKVRPLIPVDVVDGVSD